MEYTNVKGLVTGVSDIAFGTATSTLEDEAKIHDMLDYYVSIGGNYIDTSRFYGRGSGIQHTEELLGRWLAKGDNRSEVIIQSKCCNPYMDHTLTMYEDIPRVGRSYMYDDILFSRDHLCVDCIDAYLIHRGNPKVPVGEIIDTFEKWLPWFEEHRDVTVAAWSAQGRGFFGNYPQFLPENDDPAKRMAVLTPENFARKERAAILAGMKGIRPSQVSLPYVLSQKVNIAAIIGPRSIKDIDNAINATSLRLTAEELDFLNLKRDSI